MRTSWLSRTLVGLAAFGAVLAFSAAAPAQPQASKAAAPCGGTAKGAPWSYKGQKGTAYSVVGVNGASCATGIKYMPEMDPRSRDVRSQAVPAGWHCSAIGDYTALAKLGQCTTTKGGIFEWLPKRKKSNDREPERKDSTMNGTPKTRTSKLLSLLVSSPRWRSRAPPRPGSCGGLPLGKFCGSVSGATWKYQGQHGTRYNVSALPAKSCAAALKSVGALTRQKPHAGVLGPRTLAGPAGFRCVGTGIGTPASAGFCGGGNGAKFLWAPRLNG